MGYDIHAYFDVDQEAMGAADDTGASSLSGPDDRPLRPVLRSDPGLASRELQCVRSCSNLLPQGLKPRPTSFLTPNK